MKVLLVLVAFALILCSTAEAWEKIPFSMTAECLDVETHGYRYSTSLDGKKVVIDEWETDKFGTKWVFKYDHNADKFTLDGKTVEYLHSNGKIIVFGELGGNGIGVAAWTYILNTNIEKAAGTQVNAHSGLGNGIKVRSVQFKCDFRIY